MGIAGSRILVVAAHPDDEVLGCGATISRFSMEGDPVSILLLGEGISSRYKRRSEARPALLRGLQADAKAVARLLGAKSVAFENLPDNRFDELPILEIIKRIEKQIEKIKPEIIFTHHPGDLNVDHQATFRAVLTATRPTNGCPVQEIYAFEVPSSTEWAFQQFQPPFRPNVFIDVSRTMETKVKGMQRYKGECRPFPHPRSPQALRAIAQRWGSAVGFRHAEAFELIRALR